MMNNAKRKYKKNVFHQIVSDQMRQDKLFIPKTEKIVWHNQNSPNK